MPVVNGSPLSRAVMSTSDSTAAEFTFDAPTIADTVRLGQVLAEVLPAGSLVALDGTLGAGKTRLVQAVAEALGVNPRDVVSPTFVLAQQYDARRTIHHVDVYRLKDEDEFLELGVEESLAGSGLVFIEWAGRIASSLPNERLQIAISVTGPESRQFCMTALGDKYAEAVGKLRELLGR